MSGGEFLMGYACGLGLVNAMAALAMQVSGRLQPAGQAAAAQIDAYARALLLCGALLYLGTP